MGMDNSATHLAVGGIIVAIGLGLATIASASGGIVIVAGLGIVWRGVRVARREEQQIDGRSWLLHFDNLGT